MTAPDERRTPEVCYPGNRTGRRCGNSPADDPQEASPMDEKTLQRFWAKVDKDGPVPERFPELGPCWVWTAGTDVWGYGRFLLDGKKWTAHRVAWLIGSGPIPVAECVLHRCDNPPCVRHSHHFLGSSADNTADMVAKNRQPRGESNGRSKLTESQVMEIRRRYAAGGVFQSALADEYGVRPAMVSAIVVHRRWKHLPAVREMEGE